MDERTSDDALRERVAEATKLYLDPVQDEDWFNVIVNLVRVELATQADAIRLESARGFGEQAKKLRQEIAALREALATYGRHRVTCHSFTGMPCSCGLDALLAPAPRPGLNTKCDVHDNEHPDALCPRRRDA